MMSRLSRRSLFPAVIPRSCHLSLAGVRAERASRSGSGSREDVDDEHQRVGALDAGLLVAGLAVTELRGDREDHPGTDRDPVEGLVPALDDLAGTDPERGR